MFDTTQQIELPVLSPDGTKTVVVNYPTDELIIERMRKMTVVTKNLGRGKSQTDAKPNYEHDLQLFNKIRVSGDELDEYEASQVIGRLVRCSVEDSRKEGNQYVVVLKVPGAITTHTLKVPSAKQMHGHKPVSIFELRHGMQELRMNPQASKDLYDSLLVKAEGYAGEVPVPHKETVISEIVTLYNSTQDGSDIEGF